MGGGIDPLAPGPLQGFTWTTAASDNTPNFDNVFLTTGDPPQKHAVGMFVVGELVPGVTYYEYEIEAADLLGGATKNLAAAAQADGSYALPRARVEDATRTHFSAWLTVTNGPVVIDATAPTISTNAAQSNAENVALAVTLAANESVTWAIRTAVQDAASLDHDEFEISGTTLRWSSNGTRDFETPADTNTDNAYVVVVRATDTAGNTTDKTITVTVTDVAEGGAGDALLLETGDYLLLETGDRLLLEA